MTNFRSFNDLVISFIEYLRVAQPDLDTKPGTVGRDLFVDNQAQQISLLYNELRSISRVQSLLSTSGVDLERLGSNFGSIRSSGSFATGSACLTTNNLDIDVLISSGTILTSTNGISFRTTTNTLLKVSSSNVYRSNASRLRSSLDLAGITDEFAIEVPVESAVPGVAGNIGRFTLTTHTVVGIDNATNLEVFSGGSDAETDSQFRTRILSIFAGSNTGTALGYKTALTTIAGVNDSSVILPGDPLLVRDGTDVVTNSSGESAVVQPGTGGKVDIYVLGVDSQPQADSFIYTDKSGKKDPTDPSNDYVLGQRGQSSLTNTEQRRVEFLANDTIPYQPTDSISSVAGSESGSNFVQKYTDVNGEVKGNFELIRDKNNFGGSPFGFDRIHWISDTIELKEEAKTKNTFNGTDALEFFGAKSIKKIYQDVQIQNENSTTITSKRNEVVLKHKPVRTVTRVFNTTTGERYSVTNQNIDNTTGLNISGKVIISGNTLPVSTDVLQVDYIWVRSFDRTFDFDNLEDFNSNRTTQDSIYWGKGNLITREQSKAVLNGANLEVVVTHPISDVVKVSTIKNESSVVSGRQVPTSESVINVVRVKRVSDGAELFNTDLSDGSVFGTNAILLPTDTLGQTGEQVISQYNDTNVFSHESEIGTFSGKTITLIPDIVANNTIVYVTYTTSTNSVLLSNNISLLPTNRSLNDTVVGATIVGTQPVTNVFLNSLPIQNLKRSSAGLAVTVDSIVSNGVITISGTTLKRLNDVIVSSTLSDGFIVDLAAAIRSDMGISTLSSNIRVAKIVKVESVSLNNQNQVSKVLNTFDIINCRVHDNSLDLSTSLSDISLPLTSFGLPETNSNTRNRIVTGTKLRISFYYTNIDDIESIFFSRNGTLYTDKSFSYVNIISVGSGFYGNTGNIIGTVSVLNSNQPASNSIYFADYNYESPKENERITISYNYNNIITSATKAIEQVRPITADVLIKQAGHIDIDVSARIVLLPEYENQSQTVIQNATDRIVSFLNAKSLGTTIDSSDIVNTLYSVSGVDRVQITIFSVGGSGNKLSISANKNEYLRAGNVSVVIETR